MVGSVVLVEEFLFAYNFGGAIVHTASENNGGVALEFWWTVMIKNLMVNCVSQVYDASQGGSTNPYRVWLNDLYLFWIHQLMVLFSHLVWSLIVLTFIIILVQKFSSSYERNLQRRWRCELHSRRNY